MVTARNTESVEAPVDAVFDLVTRVEDWPQFFAPALYGEVLGPTPDGGGDIVQRWFLGDGEEVRVRTASRTIDAIGYRITLEDLDSPGGTQRAEWTFTPVSDGETLIDLRHELPLEGDAAVVEKNSGALLSALKETAERQDDRAELVMTFDDSVFIAVSTPAEPYRVLYEADKWPGLFEHVAALTMTEKVKNIQFFDMESLGQDGSTHSTRSARICLPERKIAYKQIQPPPLLEAHTGHWLFTEVPEGIVATSRHTVTIKRSALPMLGRGTTVADARRYLRQILSANSTANLRIAKQIAERSAA
jgi:C7-C12 aromatase (ARO/CYC)